jgi:hypothetical protein
MSEDTPKSKEEQDIQFYKESWPNLFKRGDVVNKTGTITFLESININTRFISDDVPNYKGISVDVMQDAAFIVLQKVEWQNTDFSFLDVDIFNKQSEVS